MLIASVVLRPKITMMLARVGADEAGHGRAGVLVAVGRDDALVAGAACTDEYQGMKLRHRIEHSHAAARAGGVVEVHVAALPTVDDERHWCNPHRRAGSQSWPGSVAQSPPAQRLEGLVLFAAQPLPTRRR